MSEESKTGDGGGDGDDHDLKDFIEDDEGGTTALHSGSNEEAKRRKNPMIEGHDEQGRDAEEDADKSGRMQSSERRFKFLGLVQVCFVSLWSRRTILTVVEIRHGHDC